MEPTTDGIYTPILKAFGVCDAASQSLPVIGGTG
jgi:hypothetical protein